MLAKLPNRSLEILNKYRLRLVVIAGVFVLSVFLAMRATSLRNPADVLGDPMIIMLPALALIVLLLNKPGIGILGLVVVSMVAPFSIGTGTQSRLNSAILALALLIGLYVYRFVAEKRRDLTVPSRSFVPLFAFVAVAIIAFLVGQLPWFPYASQASLMAQVGGLAVFLLSAGAYFLAANEIEDLRTLKWMTWIFLGLGAVHVFGNIVGLGAFSDRIIQYGIFSNSVFWIWLVSLALSQAVFNHELSRFWRLALFSLLAGAFYLSVIRNMGWTSGWLPSLVTAVVILLVSGSRVAWLALAAGAVAIALKLQQVISLMFSGDNQYSFMTRIEAWRIVGEMIRINPILGLGPANYYWYTPLYPILGYYVQFNSHNNYVDLIAQVGFLGLVFFLWFAFEVGRLGLWLRHRVPSGFARAYVLAAIGGLAGMLAAGMLGDWFIPFIYNVGLEGFRASILGWMFLGGLVFLKQFVFVKGESRGMQNGESIHNYR